MNDRFRFRVWRKEKDNFIKRQGAMIYNAEDVYDGCCFSGYKLNNNDGHISCFGEYLSKDDEYVTMQCTGLKDKNGKLIYEGDIVQGTSKYKYIIAYSDINACFYLQTIEPEQPNFPLNEINLKDYFEIIGNIYENKELLEM